MTGGIVMPEESKWLGRERMTCRLGVGSTPSAEDGSRCRGRNETLGRLANIPCTGAPLVTEEGISVVEWRLRPMRSLNRFEMELADAWLRMGVSGDFGG